MKKILMLFMALSLSIGAMHPQVRIGGSETPEKGAVLDLNGSNYKGGLLLPKVKINDMDEIPNDFSDASVAGKTGVQALAGTLVWNTNSGAEGVYRWDGEKWNLLTSGCNAAPASGTITGLLTSYAEGDKINLTCTAAASGLTLYIWAVPEGLKIISGNGTNKVQLEAVTVGTYRAGSISCTVTNACGSVTNNSSSDVAVTFYPASLPAGSGSFMGRACFDVAGSNEGSECGLLINRRAEPLSNKSSRADFSTTTTREQTYTFTPSGTVSNVRFKYLDSQGIIESATGGDPDNSISSAVSFTVTYKSDLNTRASGLSRANALTADIYAVYNDGSANDGTDHAIKLTAVIRDCACCGASTTSGSWLDFMCYNLGADENLSSAQQQAYTPADEFDATVYGDLFQWGRWKDGHEKRNSSTTSGTTTNNKPGSDFITVSSGSDNWYSGTNADALWSDGTDRGINDPCPDGFRVPSIAQWQSIAGGLIWDSSSPNLWTWKDTSTKGWQIGDFLFLPMAGYRNSIALVDYQGTYGLYWSSTVTGTDAYYLHFMDGSVYLDSRTSRAEGSSVRCVVD